MDSEAFKHMAQMADLDVEGSHAAVLQDYVRLLFASLRPDKEKPDLTVAAEHAGRVFAPVRTIRELDLTGVQPAIGFRVPGAAPPKEPDDE